MDAYKNVCIKPDELAADAGMGNAGIMVGGTPNVLPGSSIADEKKDHISLGSVGNELAIDPFKNMPNSAPDMTA